jgi:hypothetical protein
MTLPFEPTVDSLDAVPEDARVFYRKDATSGKFNLITAESVTKLESSLGSVRTELTTAKERAKAVEAWEKLGKKPEEIEELLENQRKADEQKIKDAGEWDKLKAQIDENHGKVVKEKDGRIKTLQSALERRLIDSEAIGAIAELKGSPTLLLPHVRNRVKVEEKDGDFHVTVLDADGKTPKLNDKNEPMSIKELVASMREDEQFGRAFEGSGHSGGGGSGGKGGSGTPSGMKKSEMSAKEKAAFMRDHGFEAYRALAD